MGIQGWTYLLVGLSFALYVGIAIASRVRSTAGFYVAGRGVPAVANGMATGADWMSAASFLSMAGLVSFMGYTGRELLIAGLVVCGLGALFGLTMFVKLRNLPVHHSMRDVSELIYETCKTYLQTQGRFILLLEVFIGAVMILMLWFYLSGLAILIGAEMNAEIEHASPYGKDSGEKVPGERRKIGPAAMRAWLARARGGSAPRPLAPAVPVPGIAHPEPLPNPATAHRLALPPARRFSDTLIGVAAIGVYLRRALGRVPRRE